MNETQVLNLLNAVDRLERKLDAVLDQIASIKTSAPERGEGTPHLTPADEALYNELREWRSSVAGDRPAYHVLSNSAMQAIAKTRPQTEMALLAIRGVGVQRVQSYAHDIFAIVRRHAEEGGDDKEW